MTSAWCELFAFGEFRRGYLVVDYAGVRALRDPFSAKPYVLFYTTKRVGAICSGCLVSSRSNRDSAPAASRR